MKKEHILATITLSSVPGNEKQALACLTACARSLHLSTTQFECLKTAVAEATMNAIEHGNQYQPDKTVSLQIASSHTAITVRIQDQGKHRHETTTLVPDLSAKLTGIQGPRGWGLFLIQSLVDEFHETGDEQSHTVELIVYRNITQLSSKEGSSFL